MKCPRCGLINPETALRCDCGWDFSTGTVKESYLGKEAMLQLDPVLRRNKLIGQILDVFIAIASAIIGSTFPTFSNRLSIITTVGGIAWAFFYFGRKKLRLGDMAVNIISDFPRRKN
jgi:hypothetical protein